jgi:hypothetical protein
MAANALEKAFCVLESSKTNCVTVAQRRFRTRFGKSPPARRSIYDWHNKFKTAGCLCKSPGRPFVSDEHHLPKQPKEIHNEGESEVTNPTTDSLTILQKLLKMTPYKLQLLQSLSDQDKTTRRDFSTEMHERCEEEGFSERLIFSDESTFHISEKLNKQNVRMWGSDNPRATVEHVRGSSKVNVLKSIIFWDMTPCSP